MMSEADIREERLALYNQNYMKRLQAMKIARQISEKAGVHTVRATVLSSMYDIDFSVTYSFTYNQFDVLNEWILSMAENHPVPDGEKDFGFIYTGTFDGQEISVNVYSIYDEARW